MIQIFKSLDLYLSTNLVRPHEVSDLGQGFSPIFGLWPDLIRVQGVFSYGPGT